MLLYFIYAFDLKYYMYYAIGKLTLNSSLAAPVILTAEAYGRPIASPHCSLYPSETKGEP